jgi:hypothetical protein
MYTSTMRYVREFFKTAASHGLRWWGSLIVAWIAGAGLFNPRVSAFIRDNAGLDVPDQFPASWIVATLLFWLIASSMHREVLRKLNAGRVTFDAPFIKNNVPLYATIGINRVLIATNDLVSISVRNDMSGGKEIGQAFCSVEIYRTDGTKVLDFEYPRWSENSKPGYEGSPSDRFPPDWNYRDLAAHGGKNEIDFIVRPHDQEVAYGFKGASQRKEKWCDPELTIPLGEYSVRLKIQGVGMIELAETWARLRVVATSERVYVDAMEKPR